MIKRAKSEKAIPVSSGDSDDLPDETSAPGDPSWVEKRTGHPVSCATLNRQIVGQSDALNAVLRQVEIAAPTTATVLIYGETGTGKELIARAFHYFSPRGTRPFVVSSCSAIPINLLESELFGHERGAFTGAIARKLGRFELAHESTLFLDEIGDIPLELQPKLLRVLQEHEFERLGDTQTRKVNVRIVAATCRDLPRMIARREFRRDLFYRLNVFPIRLPPLRERSGDIPLLVQHFVKKYAEQMGRQVNVIPADTMKELTGYYWPGNIRELQNVIERAVILSPGRVLHLSKSELEREPDILQELSAETIPEDKAVTLEDCEREHILKTLQKTHWVVGGNSGAATVLGLKRTTLLSKMKKLGIGQKSNP